MPIHFQTSHKSRIRTQMTNHFNSIEGIWIGQLGPNLIFIVQRQSYFWAMKTLDSHNEYLCVCWFQSCQVLGFFPSLYFSEICSQTGPSWRWITSDFPAKISFMQKHRIGKRGCQNQPIFLTLQQKSNHCANSCSGLFLTSVALWLM